MPYYTFCGVRGLFCKVAAYAGCTQYQQRALSHNEAVNMAAMGDLQPVRLLCHLSDFEHCKAIDCGVYRYHPRETTTVHLRQCTKNIRSHLQKCKVAASDVSVEWKLILVRYSLFDVDNYCDKSMCPTHRYKLGLSWTSPRKCFHPLHEGKGRPFRGVNKTTSRDTGGPVPPS